MPVTQTTNQQTVSLMSTTPNVLFPQINVIFQMYPEMIPDYLAPLFIIRVKKSRSKTKQSS